MASTGGTRDWSISEESVMVQEEYSDAIGFTPSKRGRLRALASKAKAKSKDVLSVSGAADGHQDISDDNDEDLLLADAAFAPPNAVDGSVSRADDSSNGISGGLDSAKQMLLHPRRAIRKKATKTTAGKISSAAKPYLSSDQQRDFLDAHDALANAEASASSVHASDTTSLNTDTDIGIARTKIARMEAHRDSLKTAWAVGRHVDRVRVIQTSMPKPCRADFANETPTRKTVVDWPRYIARLVVYYTYGFTSHYIEDLESPPFDIGDLALTIERLAVITGPWQTFFLSCRQIYTWESPKRTLKWAALFWSLWYTNHLVGFFYLWIIFATIRNRFYPSSVSSIRESMERGLDREKKAQAWEELIERHGHSDWMEPLLDELGPMIQLQLRDLVDFLEVLSNFYRWERPYKTAQTLFVALVLLLITLFCDTTFCVRLVWLNVGGAFFLTFPIATNFPKYRKAVNLFHWFFWDIPTNAELGIIRLQEKAVLHDAKARAGEHAHESWNSSSDYETAPETAAKSHKERLKSEYSFRAYHGKSSGILSITRSGVCWSPRRSSLPQTTIPFTRFLEMRKLESSSQSKSTKMIRPNTDGLLFVYDKAPATSSPASGSVQRDPQQIAVHVKGKNRHKIFNLVLAWSGQKWQPLATERHKNKTDQHETFDKALKRALQ